MRGAAPDFDRIARPYRWLEYLTLGRALERCRLHFLPDLRNRTNALALGDGDGRFLASLLARNATLEADAVDTSSKMLALLRQRCPGAGPRLKTHHTDALNFVTIREGAPYDLVVTHFFLDCLTQRELVQISFAIRSHLAPGALWSLSDFRIPPGAMRLPAAAMVGFLYFGFRILTGLRVKRLPDHATALAAAGFTLRDRHLSLNGVLTAELWEWGPPVSLGRLDGADPHRPGLYYE